MVRNRAGHALKRKIREYVRKWEGHGYPRGIPDEAPSTLERLNKVPSYRIICQAIMKNDVALMTLGYQRAPCEAYNVLKRIELVQRGVIRIPVVRQLILPIFAGAR